MNRADIIARILDRVQFLTGYAPDTLALAKPLMGQGWLELDSIDLMEIAMAVEEEFSLEPLVPGDDWSIDMIADLIEKAEV